MVTFGTVGVLAGAIMAMKFKADLKFQTTMKQVVRVRIIKPVKVWFNATPVGQWLKARKPFHLKTYEIGLDDVGKNQLYNKNTSLGLSVKITNEGKAQITNVMPLSVAESIGLLPMMELEQINDLPRTFQNSTDAIAAINNNVKDVFVLEAQAR